MWQIVKYDASMEEMWNKFVAESRNGTFLFNRGYMDYHADRFSDSSRIALKNGKPVALLPANITDDGVLHSHGGLTYGGWILPPAHLDGSGLLEIFENACDAWRAEGIKALDYKTVPCIYWSRPSAEDEYALFRLGACISETNLSAAIPLAEPVKFNKLRRRHLAKASHLPIEIVETDDIQAFMEMLADCLLQRHGALPVHSADQMRLLKSRFPDNIRMHAVKYEGELQAGVCIYNTGIVAHCQYIATTSRGRELNLLTPLFSKLIGGTYAGCRYFDFGTSNEDHGRMLNEGLLRQKYSYGASGVVYNRYLLKL